jgi:hypothetical protein
MMKVDNRMRAAIRAAAKGCVPGSHVVFEYGTRTEEWTPNALNWADEDDLQEVYPLVDLAEIDDCPAHPGWAMLDLYAYRDGCLECNVYVLIKDGAVSYATSSEPGISRKLFELGLTERDEFQASLEEI